MRGYIYVFLIKKDVRGYSLATMVISVTVLAFIVTAITMWGISFSKGVEKAKANGQYENAAFVKINSLIASDYSTLESEPKNDADEIPVSVTVSEEKDINGTKGKVVNIKVYDKNNKNKLRKDFSTNIYAPLKPSTDYVYNLDKAINQVSVSKWQEPRTKRWFIRPKVNGEMTAFYSTNGIDIDNGGYMKWADGTIWQWGVLATGRCDNSIFAPLKFKHPFAEGVSFIVANYNNNGHIVPDGIANAVVKGYDNESITFRCADTGSAPLGDSRIQWMAIGR